MRESQKTWDIMNSRLGLKVRMSALCFEHSRNQHSGSSLSAASQHQSQIDWSTSFLSNTTILRTPDLSIADWVNFWRDSHFSKDLKCSLYALRNDRVLRRRSYQIRLNFPRWRLGPSCEIISLVGQANSVVLWHRFYSKREILSVAWDGPKTLIGFRRRRISGSGV